MAKEKESPKALRKIIDIPGDIVKDLKNMADISDKNLKIYIQDALVTLVNKNRDPNNPGRKN